MENNINEDDNKNTCKHIRNKHRDILILLSSKDSRIFVHSVVEISEPDYLPLFGLDRKIEDIHQEVDTIFDVNSITKTLTIDQIKQL